MAESGVHPARIGLALLSGVAGGLLFFEAPVAYQVSCDRSKGVCTFTEQRLGRSRVSEANIALLSQALVRAATLLGLTREPASGSCRKRLGTSSLAPYWSSEEAEEAARKVNAFLQNPTAGHVVVTKSVPLTCWIAGALIPVIATLLVLIAAAVLGRKTKAPRLKIPPP